MHPVTKSRRKQEVVVVPDVTGRRRAAVRPRWFLCPSEGCTQGFRHASTLKIHLRTHTGEKPFVCSYEDCGRAFAQSGHLTVHLRAHAGKKIFFCRWEGCGYGFVASSTLTRHKRRHTGEKPFVCHYKGCGRAFAQSGDLKTHLCVHTGEKPFACPCEGCAYATTGSKSLKRHLRTHAKAKSSSMATAACPRLQAAPASERDRPGICVSSDSSAAITTVPATGHPLPGAHGISPVMAEPLWPRLGRPASPRSQVEELPGLALERASPGSASLQGSQPGCAQAVSRPGELMPGGSEWHADDSLAWLLQPLHTTRASDPHLLSFSCADEDKIFWQTLIWPEADEVR